MGGFTTKTGIRIRLNKIEFTEYHYLNLKEMHLIPFGVHEPIKHFGGSAGRIQIGKIARDNLEEVNKYLISQNLPTITESVLENEFINYFRTTYPQLPIN